MFDLNSAKKEILQAQKESSGIHPSGKMRQNQTHYFIRICQKHTHSSFTECPSAEGPIYTQRHKKLKEEVYHLLLRKLCGHDHPMYPQRHIS
jgi:glucose-6-phosphate isomerase